MPGLFFDAGSDGGRKRMEESEGCIMNLFFLRSRCCDIEWKPGKNMKKSRDAADFSENWRGFLQQTKNEYENAYTMIKLDITRR